MSTDIVYSGFILTAWGYTEMTENSVRLLLRSSIVSSFIDMVGPVTSNPITRPISVNLLSFFKVQEGFESLLFADRKMTVQYWKVSLFMMQEKSSACAQLQHCMHPQRAIRIARTIVVGWMSGKWMSGKSRKLSCFKPNLCFTACSNSSSVMSRNPRSRSVPGNYLVTLVVKNYLHGQPTVVRKKPSLLKSVKSCAECSFGSINFNPFSFQWYNLQKKIKIIIGETWSAHSRD